MVLTVLQISDASHPHSGTRGSPISDFYTPQRDKISLNVPDAMREDLPKVLLIGDSISQGYTWPVMDLLEGVCNVRRPRANCGDTRLGCEMLDRWLGDVQWDLIHFNWGLHDLCYRHPESTFYGHRDKQRGTISVPLENYAPNLQSLVERLLAHTPHLIWASTTVVPVGEAGRYEGDEEKYNAVAAEIMNRHGIPIDDLYSFSTSFDASMFVEPGDVHFTEAGMQKLAEQVARAIRQQLDHLGI